MLLHLCKCLIIAVNLDAALKGLAGALSKYATAARLSFQLDISCRLSA